MSLETTQVRGRGTPAKILAGLLLVALISASLVGVFSRCAQDGTVAHVANQDISAEAFERGLSLEAQRLASLAQGDEGEGGRAEILRHYFSDGSAQSFLARLARDALLDQLGEDLWLTVPSDVLVESIARRPEFLDERGQFDKKRFSETLEAEGIEQGDYISAVRKQAARAQIIDALVPVAGVPDAIAKVVHLEENQKRSGHYVELEVSPYTPPDPSPETLQRFYAGVAKDFSAPERRSLDILVLSPSSVEKALYQGISEKQLKDRYDLQRRKGLLGSSETRSFVQIPFADLASARAACAHMQKTPLVPLKGRFLSVDEGVFTSRDAQGRARHLPLIGPVSRANFKGDDALKRAVFSPSHVEGYCFVVEDTHRRVFLVRIVSIRPSSIPTFEKVKGALRRQIAQSSVAQKILDIRDDVEGELALGDGSAPSLKSVSQRVGGGRGVRFIALSDVAQSDFSDPKGQTAASVPDVPPRLLRKVLDEAFHLRADAAATRDVNLQRDGDVTVWYQLVRVKPSSERPLDQVKEQVVQRWRQEMYRKELGRYALAALAQLDRGEPLGDVAARRGLHPKVIDRLGFADDYRPYFSDRQDERDRFFRLKKGDYFYVPQRDDRPPMIVQVTRVDWPEGVPSATQMADIREHWADSLSNQLTEGLISDLERRYGGIKVNSPVFEKIRSFYEE